MEGFLSDVETKVSPLRNLVEFLEEEAKIHISRDYSRSRFVGYVLEIRFDKITIITSDPFKLNVGGIPRNSLLIMVSDPSAHKHSQIPPNFTVLEF